MQELCLLGGVLSASVARLEMRKRVVKARFVLERDLSHGACRFRAFESEESLFSAIHHLFLTANKGHERLDDLFLRRRHDTSTQTHR